MSPIGGRVNEPLSVPAVTELKLPSTVARTLSPQTRHYYRVTLSAGALFELEAEARGGDVGLTLEDRDGLPLLSVDSPLDGSGTETIKWVASYSGDYFVTVYTPLEKWRAANYTLHVQARSATATDRQWVAALASFNQGSGKFQGRQPENLRRARADYERAYRLWQGVEDTPAAARALYMSGRASLDLREFAEAGRRLTEAKVLYESVGDKAGLAVALKQIGYLYGELGYASRGVSAYREALALWRELGSRSQEADTLLHLGVACQKLYKTDEALEFFAEALSLAQRVGDPYQEATALTLRGRLLLSLKKPESALADLERSLILWRKIGNRKQIAEVLIDKGYALKRFGAEERSLTSFEEALQIRLISSDSAQSDVQLLDRNSEIVFQLAKAVGDLSSATAAKFLSAQFERASGDLVAARRSIEAAIKEIEDQGALNVSSRPIWQAARQRMYELYIEVLMDLHERNSTSGFDAVAFAASERARSQSMLDMWGTHRAEEGESRHSTGTAQPVNRCVTVGDVQKAIIEPGDLLLYYELGQERSFLWALTSTSFSSHILPSRADVELLSRSAQKWLSTSRRPTEAVQARLALLSKALLTPVADQLPARRLIIVADGALSVVPFGSLPSPGSAEPLFMQSEVVSIPSIEAVDLLRRRRTGRPAPPKTIAVIADPVFEPDDPRLRGTRAAQFDGNNQAVVASLPRLPFTAQEAKAILSLVPPGQGEELVGFSAHRQAVLGGELSKYRLIHFATHGLVDADYPGLSQLMLSRYDEQGRPQRSSISVSEISQLNLSADLVVLSACQTGIGREASEEGLMSLTEAFLGAGASRTLVSLWTVEDQATQRFMDHFYQYLLTEQMPPAEALRQAQIWMSTESPWKAPYYWAGFVLVGDWQ